MVARLSVSSATSAPQRAVIRRESAFSRRDAPADAHELADFARANDGSADLNAALSLLASGRGNSAKLRGINPYRDGDVNRHRVSHRHDYRQRRCP